MPEILKLLKKHGIQATCFGTGHATENNPEMVHRVRDAKHETGCHGLYHETLGAAVKQLDRVCAMLKERAGRFVTAGQLATEQS